MNDLTLISCRLTGAFDERLGALSENEKEKIIAMLCEDIIHCTAGFHNRVHACVLSMSRSKNLSELLFLVRQRIVASVGLAITSDIHVFNEVTRIASEELSFCRNTHRQDDPHHGNVSSGQIKRWLKNMIQALYTPVIIPHLLLIELKSLLAEVGYRGRTQGEENNVSCYDLGEIQAMNTCIRRLFPI